MEKTRKEFDAFMLNYVTHYVASRFLGKGKFERLEAKTKEELLELLSKQNFVINRRPWILYAICNYGEVDHSIQLENYPKSNNEKYS